MILFQMKRREKLAKNCKSKSVKADLEEVRRTYVIERLKIGKAKHDYYNFE